MVTVLMGYSFPIVNEVTRPESGLQRTCKFPPRIAEIVEACDAIAARVARFSRYQNWGKETIAARLEGPAVPKPTAEEMAAKYGPNFGIRDPEERTTAGFTPNSGQALPFNEIAEHYASHPDRMKHLTEAPGRRKSLRVP